MNHDLESLLRELPLRQPSETLDRKIERLGLSWRPKLKVTLALGVLAAAAAIALAIVLARGSANTAQPAAPELALSRPAATETPRLEQTWSVVNYVGAVPQADGVPLRIFRQQSLRTVRWVDETGTTREATEPKEEIITVAAEMY